MLNQISVFIIYMTILCCLNGEMKIYNTCNCFNSLQSNDLLRLRWTHWATLRRQSSLLIADCSASSQVMPVLFKSWRIVSIQFFLGLPGFAWRNGLLASTLLALVFCYLLCVVHAPTISVFSP